jgi:hypothetical protein
MAGDTDSSPRPACTSLANRVVLFAMMNKVRIHSALLIVINGLPRVALTFTASES